VSENIKMHKMLEKRKPNFQDSYFMLTHVIFCVVDVLLICAHNWDKMLKEYVTHNFHFA
jgi:hypothetical protein